MASASAVRVYSGAAMPSVQGMDRVQAMVARLPNGMLQAIAPALDKSADELVAVMQEFAPQNELDPNPGDLRRSIHKAPGESASGIAVRVVADAVGTDGEHYPAHVEYGHKAKDGRHVAPEPFFWPAYTILKKKIRARVSRAMSAVVKRFSARGQ